MLLFSLLPIPGKKVFSTGTIRFLNMVLLRPSGLTSSHGVWECLLPTMRDCSSWDSMLLSSLVASCITPYNLAHLKWKMWGRKDGLNVCGRDKSAFLSGLKTSFLSVFLRVSGYVHCACMTNCDGLLMSYNIITYCPLFIINHIKL